MSFPKFRVVFLELVINTMSLFCIVLFFVTFAHCNTQYDVDSKIRQQYTTYKYCSDDSVAASACFQGFFCNLGYRCEIRLNLCCPPAAHQSRCPDNSLSVSYCTRGGCDQGFYCTSGNLCCRSYIGTTTSLPTSLCPTGAQPLGFCSNNVCRAGYFCNGINNLCCPSLSQQCPDGSLSAGTCNNGKCGSDYMCSSTGFCCLSRQCLDGSVPVGTCLNSRCAPGYICSPFRYCCSVPAANCPNGETPAGLCISGVCSLPYTCVTGLVCCVVKNYMPTSSSCKTILDCQQTNRTTSSMACINEKCVIF